MFSAGGVDVCFREGRCPDRERVLGADQLYQLARVFKPALGLGPVACTVWRVAAEREHILNPDLLHLVERRAQLIDSRINAGEVRHRFDSVFVADARNDLDRLVAR